MNLHSPIVRIETQLLTQKEIELYIKRDDLIHPLVSGNKHRKLKYNLSKLNPDDHPTIVTFGGAFSNHLHATAAACQAMKFACVGFVRGEIDIENPTLKYCISAGMELIPMSRSDYRLKEIAPEVAKIISTYNNPIIVPEGGTNQAALLGVSELIDELQGTRCENVDYITLACGTGGTTAGLLTSDRLRAKVIAFSALKSDHLIHEIKALSSYKNEDKLIVNTDYHFGGYAKWDQTLLDFITDFEKETSVPLDHVYNGKALYGLMDLIANDYFPKGTKIMHIHTGGLQGKAGLAYIMSK